MRYAFKIIARAPGALDTILKIDGRPIIPLAQDLYSRNNVIMYLHGSSVGKIYPDFQSPTQCPKLSDLDFVAFDHSTSFLKSKETIERFFDAKMSPLFHNTTRCIFAYQLKNEKTNPKFSITLYVQTPPASLFDDIAHSSMIQLMPNAKLCNKYPDENLVSFCSAQKLLFTPSTLIINKHFFRTAMREARGWDAQYNPALDSRIYNQFLISSLDPSLFKKEFLSVFKEHFEPHDKEAFIKMAFFALSRICRHAGLLFTSQFFDTIKDMFNTQLKRSFKNFSDFLLIAKTSGKISNPARYLDNTYLAPNPSSVFLFANLVEKATTPTGKLDVFSDFALALHGWFQLPFLLNMDPQRHPHHHILAAWGASPNPPSQLFESVICPILNSCTVEERTDYLSTWMRQKRIHLSVVEHFFKSTPPLLNRYLTYISELIAFQKHPSIYLKKKLHRYSPQAPRIESPNQRSLPDPTLGLELSLGAYLHSKKMFLCSDDSLSFMDYAALESAGWTIHNAAVDTTLYEQGMAYNIEPEKFLEDLRETCSAYFQEHDLSSRRKTAFFAFSRLYRHSNPEEMAMVWQHVQTFLSLGASETPEDFAKSLKKDNDIEKPMPFLKQKADPLASALQIKKTLSSIETSTDISFLHKDLDKALYDLLDTKSLEHTEAVIKLCQFIREKSIPLSSKTCALAIKYFYRLDETQKAPDLMHAEWAFLIQHSVSHPLLNFSIYSLFQRFCSDPLDPMMGPALIHYSITNQAPISSSKVLKSLVLLEDCSPYKDFIIGTFSNPVFIDKEPINSVLTLAQRLLATNQPVLYRGTLANLLSRPTSQNNQQFLALDTWLPTQTKDEDLLFLETMDRFVQAGLMLPERFYEPLLKSLQTGPFYSNYPGLTDAIFSTILSQSPDKISTLLPIILDIKPSLPKTYSTILTLPKSILNGLPASQLLPFIKQTGPSSESKAFQLLKETITHYASEPSRENFLTCITYCTHSEHPNTPFKAHALDYLLDQPSDQQNFELLRSSFLALPFNMLTPAQLYRLAMLNPCREITLALTAHDVGLWQPNAFKIYLDVLINTQLSDPTFPELLNHYCKLHKRGYSFFSKDTLPVVLQRLADSPEDFSDFLKQITTRDYLKSYQALLFTFLSSHTNLLPVFIDLKSLPLTTAFITSALQIIRNDPTNTTWDALFNAYMEFSRTQDDFLKDYCELIIPTAPSLKQRLGSFPNLLASAKSYKKTMQERIQLELNNNTKKELKAIQRLFSQADTAWTRYIHSKNPETLFPINTFENIITHFKSIDKPLQSKILNHTFTFNNSKEYIYALPFFTTNLELVRYFYDTFNISPKTIIDQNPQLISFCLDRDAHNLLSFLFEHNVSPNLAISTAVQPMPMTIFDYCKQKNATQCVNSIMLNPLFDSGPYLPQFIVCAALTGDMDTLLKLSELPSLTHLSDNIKSSLLDTLFLQLRTLNTKKLPENSIPCLEFLYKLKLLDPNGTVCRNHSSPTPISALSFALVLESKNDLMYDQSLQGLSTFLLHLGADLNNADVENSLLFIYARFQCYNPLATPILEKLYAKLSQICAPTDSKSIENLFNDDSFSSEEHALILVKALDEFFGEKIRGVPCQSNIVGLAIKYFPNYLSVILFLKNKEYSFDRSTAENIHISLFAGKYAPPMLFDQLVQQLGMSTGVKLTLYSSTTPPSLIISHLNLAELLTVLNQTDPQRLLYSRTIKNIDSNIKYLTDRGMLIRSEISSLMPRLKVELKWLSLKV